MGWIPGGMLQFSSESNTKTIKNHVENNIHDVNNLIIYGDVLGNIKKCENVYIIGGSVLGNLNNNGMVFGCDNSETTKVDTQNNNLFHDPVTISPYR